MSEQNLILFPDGVDVAPSSSFFSLLSSPELKQGVTVCFCGWTPSPSRKIRVTRPAPLFFVLRSELMSGGFADRSYFLFFFSITGSILGSWFFFFSAFIRGASC